ncbi:MAG: hypothetical protein ABII18_06115 [bacterium]|nr:hypothetical protein [bacterium]MBU1917197.1 hypothetical protein [bacterium]
MLKVGQNLPTQYVERAQTQTIDKARHVERCVQEVSGQGHGYSQNEDRFEMASNSFEKLYGYKDSRMYNQDVTKAQMKYSEQYFSEKGERYLAELRGETKETTVGDLKIRNTRSYFV